MGKIGWISRPPKLSEAPDWANWLCQDEDGMWGWFEYEPILIPMNAEDASDDRFWGCLEDKEDEYIDQYEHLYQGIGRTLSPLDVTSMKFKVKED